MAMKVKGITIELTADTSGLEQALKGINKALSQTQKDLKDVDKALKLDPKNTELLEQKQRLLAKSVEETTKKLEALKKAQDSIADRDSDSGQRMYDALMREISKTEQNLKGLNNEQVRFNEESRQMQFQSSGVGSALGKVSEVAGNVAKNTAALSAGAATALSGLVAMTVSASNFADEMLSASQQTGLSTDAVQKLYYASGQIDVPFETVASSIAKMKSHLEDTSGIWEKLGVDVQTRAGDYRDIEDIFFETVGALSEIENETERDTMAMQIFGRSADEMAGIIDDGGQKMRALGDAAASVGNILPEGDLQTLGDFNDKIEELKSSLRSLAAQSAVPLAEALLPGIEVAVSALSKLAGVVSGISPSFLKFATAALAIVAALSPVASAISSVTKAISSLIYYMPLVIAAFKSLGAALLSFMSNPVVLTIMAIVAALALLAAGIYVIVDNWDAISAAASDAFDSIKSGISSAGDAISSFASSIGSGIQSGFETAKDIVSDFIGKVGEMSGLDSVISAIGDAFGGVAEAIKDALDTAMSIFEAFVGKAADAGASIVDGFVSGVKSVIQSVQAAFQQLADAISSVWSAIQGEAQQAGRGTATAFANGVASGPRAQIQAPTYNGGGGGSRGGGGGLFGSIDGFGAGELLSAVNTLNNNIVSLGSSPTNVNVTLSGSAKNIFDTVRVQNTKLQTATGYHALA